MEEFNFYKMAENKGVTGVVTTISGVTTLHLQLVGGPPCMPEDILRFWKATRQFIGEASLAHESSCGTRIAMLANHKLQSTQPDSAIFEP